MTLDSAAVIDWIGQQQRLGPLVAAGEAGPTGFESARALEAAGIR